MGSKTPPPDRPNLSQPPLPGGYDPTLNHAASGAAEGAAPGPDGFDANVANDADSSNIEEGVTSPRTSHDAFFKHLFGHSKHAAAALQVILPAEATSFIDWDTLQLESATTVQSTLRQRHGDLLYSAQVRDDQGDDQGDNQSVLLHLLFEHQSTVTQRMIWRLGEHVFALMQQHEKDGVAPTVVPVVMYNGIQSWTAPETLDQLTQVSGEMHTAFGGRLMSFGYFVDDLSGVSTEALLARDLDPFPRVGLVAMKYSRSEDILEHFIAVGADILILAQTEDGREALFVIYTYIIAVNPHIDRAQITDELSRALGPEIREAMLTSGQRLEKEIYKRVMGDREKVAQDAYERGLGDREQLEQQAHQKGQRAILQGILTRLFGPLSDENVARLANATTAELELWSLRIFDANELDDVFADS